jgi:single-strand DNA-binding protein
MNKAEIKGNVGADPVTRDLPGGKKVVSFPVATSESWTDKKTGEKRQSTDWHNISIMDQAAAAFAMENVRKGDLVEAKGQMKTGHWEKDGVPQSKTEIVVPFEDGFKLVAKAREKAPAPV